MASICADDGFTTGAMIQFWSNREIDEFEFTKKVQEAFKEVGLQMTIQAYDTEDNEDEGRLDDE